MDETRSPLTFEIDPDQSIPDLLVAHAERTPSRVLVEEQVDGVWHEHTAAEFHAQVLGVAKGLVVSGVEPGDRVAIMARTRFEWTLLDFAIWYAGAVPVPVYETSSVEQCRWILSDSAVVLAVGEHEGHRAILEEAGASVRSLREILVIDDGAVVDLTARGAELADNVVQARYGALAQDDLATVIYTSGTTGRPKGAELTHGNFVNLSLAAITSMSEVLTPHARTLLFMPLAHVFARYVEVLAVAAGVPLGHTPDTKDAVTDLGTFKPTFILSVPRVFERVYNASEAKAAAGGKTKIFRWAAATSIAYSRSLDAGGPSLGLKVRYRLAHKLVLHKIQQALGGQCEFAVSGGAALGERLGHFYRGVGLTVLEGYGLTETTAPLTVNRPSRVRIGSVGIPLPGAAVRIGSDGEVLASGIPVFRGYHGNSQATSEAFSGEWFHTGDLGSIDDDGFVRITGRKKEIIVTASGKNVAPAPLEDSIRSHPLVSQCLVVGDGRPFVSALITLDADMLPAWLRNHDLPELTVAEAATDPNVRASVGKAVVRANAMVSRAESIRLFEILDTDFTVANDFLTPSLKVKRAAVLADLDSLVDSIYAKAAAERSAERERAQQA